jgi:cytochrome c-type biogenesis protein CcmF
MLRRLAGLPLSMFGTTLAHLGLGLTTLGVVGVLSFESENILSMRPGDTAEIAGRALRFESIDPVKGPNYTEDRATFALLDEAGQPYASVVSAKRFYPVRQMPTTEAGIRTMGFSQLYISIGDQTADGALVVRIWWKPMVTLIWLGALVMMGGGAVSLFDRRLRVGAPARRRKAASGRPGEAAA